MRITHLVTDRKVAFKMVVVGGVSRRRSCLQSAGNRDLEIPPTRERVPRSSPRAKVSP